MRGLVLSVLSVFLSACEILLKVLRFPLRVPCQNIFLFPKRPGARGIATRFARWRDIGDSPLASSPDPPKEAIARCASMGKGLFFSALLFAFFPAFLQRDFRERNSPAFLRDGRTKGDGAHLACSCAPSRFSSCAFWLKFSRKWRKSCSGMGFA